MLATPICVCLVLALSAVSYRHARATRKLWDIAAPFLARESRPAQLAPTAEAARAWVAELNEATIELGSRLGQAGVVARACAKAALALGALGALLDGAALLDGEPASAVVPLLSFVGGCVGAVGCFWIGRAAERDARRLRGAWDALIRQSARDVAT